MKKNQKKPILRLFRIDNLRKNDKLYFIDFGFYLYMIYNINK